MRPVRLGLAGLLTAVVPIGLHAAGTAAEPVYTLELEAGPLLGCLEQIALAARVAIVDRSERVAAAACTGRSVHATLPQALDQLLVPAGLTWRRRDDGAIEVIQALPGERVDLSALTIEDTPLPSLAPVTAATPPVTSMAHEAMSITRVERERLSAAPLLSLAQIARYAPNVYASGASLAIRGQERDLDPFSGLSVRLDGIDLGSSLIEGDMVPVEGLAGLELQRGPRSFERGGNATAGALDLYTAAPTDSPSLRASAGLGNDTAMRGSITGSTRFGDSESGMRLALERRVLAEYVHEVYVPEANRDYRVVDNLYAKLNAVPEWLPGFSLEFALLAVSGDDPALYIAAGQFPFPLARERRSYAREAGRTQARALGAALNLQYGRDDWNLRLSANSTFARQEGLWLGSGFGPSGDLNNERRRAVGLSGRYTPGDWEMAAGVEFSAVSFADTDTLWISGFRRVADNREDLDFRTRSGWLWLGHHWGDRLSAGIGLRQVEEKVQQRYISISCTIGAGITPRPGACATRASQLEYTEGGRADTSTPVPFLVGNWDINDNNRLSLSHGRGIRSAGTRPEYTQKPERDDSSQLTWQANWFDERLKARLAVFRTLIRERFHLATNSIGARGRVHGAEFELDARLGERWRATLGLGLLDARYDYYRYYNENPSPRLPGAPKYTVLAGLRYGAEQGWYGTLDAYHAAEAETALDINPGNRRPAYSLADLRLGYRLDAADFSLTIANATDELYLDRVDFRYNVRRQETRYRLGDPRRIELRWQYEWQ
ncbi:MAG: TonB-dependent receptor [Rhodanobacteraceae bacterium]|nr:TonB-dependent receptor [Rhodanobacteraceae bacterium]